MTKYTSAIVIMLITINGVLFGQIASKVYTPQELDKQPEFPDAQAALFSYLLQNIKYPSKAKENGYCSKTIIQFIIKKNGKATFEDCEFAYCDLPCKKMKKVIQKMPRWTIGLKNGKPVRVSYKLPIIIHWE